MALNRLSDALVADGSTEEVAKCEKKMAKAFEKFKMACDLYQKLLVADDDFDECAAYFRETESRLIPNEGEDKFLYRIEHTEVRTKKLPRSDT